MTLILRDVSFGMFPQKRKNQSMFLIFEECDFAIIYIEGKIFYAEFSIDNPIELLISLLTQHREKRLIDKQCVTEFNIG